MISRTNRLASRVRMLIAGSVVATALLVPLSLSAPEAGALSTSPFCTALFSWAEHQPPTPTTLTLTGYRAWAKALEPFYEQLASEAPNAASKSVLNEVVVLKYYVSSTSISKLDASVLKYQAKWQAGANALAKAIESCAKSLE